MYTAAQFTAAVNFFCCSSCRMLPDDLAAALHMNQLHSNTLNIHRSPCHISQKDVCCSSCRMLLGDLPAESCSRSQPAKKEDS